MEISVPGAGGFIGGHLVKRLLDDGHQVRAVDIQPLELWHQVHGAADSLVADCSTPEGAREAVSGVQWVYDLAADMGGIGFITANKVQCMLSVETGLNLLRESARAEVERFFYASSACVYPDHLQDEANVRALRESDAYPAMPEDGYGWEKLFMERLCRHFREEVGLETRIARYHNVYGPHGTFEGGREKAPAAVCRKVAEAVVTGDHHIEVWGDGRQTRSFMYVADCVQGTIDIATDEGTGAGQPYNLGSAHLVTINHLVEIVEEMAGVRLKRLYVDGPQGVRGRNSDNTEFRARFGWEPTIDLRTGLAVTYRSIIEELRSRLP